MWNQERINKLSVLLNDIQIILYEIKYDLLLLKQREEKTLNEIEKKKELKNDPSKSA